MIETMNPRIAFVVLLSAACGASGAENGTKDAGPDVTSSAIPNVGAPCVPAEEADASFKGFLLEEVNIQERHPQCAGGVCLLNHFRGRTTCPYGDCATKVAPQCSDRRPKATVLCSCRCANAAGKTDDGASYCTCPDSLACTQIVTAIGGKTDTLSGAYCIPKGTEYVKDAACKVACDPQASPCP